MSEPKLNIKEETSAKKTRSPPKKTKVEQSVPKKKKLKTDAEKAAEKAQHLRFGKAELTPSAFNLAICFSTALGVIPIRRASAVALSVLSCESKAMIFSLLFTFFSLLFILPSHYDKSCFYP